MRQPGGFKDALAGVVVMAVVLLVVSWLTGCSSLPEERPPGAQDVAKEALCPPLPVCDIPGNANAKQLTEALWSCVLEYRALYSMCKHGTAPDLQAVPAEVF
jgi:hypothetical protein